MKRQLFEFALFLAAPLALGACNLDTESMEADKFASMNLTPEERAVAEALVAGFKKDTGLPILRSREYGRAACYAKTVDMPDHLRSAHLAYLANYTEADADYYGFFARRGLGEQNAYEVFQRYEAADRKCSAGGLLGRIIGD
ncbi:hypothetical protein [Croceicoccus naphthovorans]|uniref:Uncharacterized protein n=1 Tax=Croceicoccus naphthovorans TaxID=1348774 RepID=A0A0G3XJQ4_9SPHN|nr:hypothetical protein [Croceicoccus naphthovorans]AKM10829.1 hypothetical protein AB433_14020 [Croceicoccus naphthovorans]MBB3989045.1 hypothetical protein [Croceicoccus naphthovorans]